MPLYEHVFLARQDLSQAQVDALAATATEIVEQGGGKVSKTETWGLKGLAYKIDRNRKAHYVLLNIEAPGAVVAELELTQKQAATLWLISANPGVSQVSVAAALDMDRATMMSITDRLEERGLVIRKRSSVDRRRQELYLTPAGISRLRKVKARIAEHEARIKALFKPAELAALLEALKKFQDLR